jgi:hypothetical protein
MKPASLTVPEALANLENPFIPGGQESLHTKLGRGMEIAAPDRDGIYVQFRSRCRDQSGGLYFQVTPAYKKIPDGVHHQGSQPESRSPMG